MQAHVEHQIFAEVQRQLQQHLSRVREGQIIDASTVRVPIQHNTSDEQAVVKEQAVPPGWPLAKRAKGCRDALGEGARQVVFRLQAVCERGSPA